MNAMRFLAMLASFILCFICMSIAFGYREPITSPTIWGIFGIYWFTDGLVSFLKWFLRE